eukprot:6175479-Pleurochrysis_carterae.AAC.1
MFAQYGIHTYQNAGRYVRYVAQYRRNPRARNVLFDDAAAVSAMAAGTGAASVGCGDAGDRTGAAVADAAAGVEAMFYSDGGHASQREQCNIGMEPTFADVSGPSSSAGDAETELCRRAVLGEGDLMVHVLEFVDFSALRNAGLVCRAWKAASRSAFLSHWRRCSGRRFALLGEETPWNCETVNRLLCVRRRIEWLRLDCGQHFFDEVSPNHFFQAQPMQKSLPSSLFGGLCSQLPTSLHTLLLHGRGFGALSARDVCEQLMPALSRLNSLQTLDLRGPLTQPLLGQLPPRWMGGHALPRSIRTLSVGFRLHRLNRRAAASLNRRILADRLPDWTPARCEIELVEGRVKAHAMTACPGRESVCDERFTPPAPPPLSFRGDAIRARLLCEPSLFLIGRPLLVHCSHRPRLLSGWLPPHVDLIAAIPFTLFAVPNRNRRGCAMRYCLVTSKLREDPAS